MDEFRSAGERAYRALKQTDAHVSFAESLTGGLIAATLVGTPGASEVLNESYVTYSPEAKMRILGVSKATVENLGVVSEECAREMAVGVRRISGAEWGVSATGVAGPDGGTDKTPVGTVFIGVAGPEGVRVYEKHFPGKREEVRGQTVQFALAALAMNISSAAGQNSE